MTDEDVICLPVPLFHSFGMIVGKWIKNDWKGSMSLTVSRNKLECSRWISPGATERAFQRRKSPRVCGEVQVLCSVRRTNHVRHDDEPRVVRKDQEIISKVSGSRPMLTVC
jgi:acyl-CoA synthetase (AMP-forming)/AMP-acid ligase II